MLKPIFIQTKGETGLETLIDHGRLPETPHFPEAQSWPEINGNVEALTSIDHPYKTLVIDTGNGAERLMHEFVCNRDFGGDWGDKGFMGYMRGFEVSLAEWLKFLSALDKLRSEKRMAVVVLCHTRVKPFKNPEGPDFDRYMPDMHEKSWGLSHKWADVVLFGNYEVVVKTDKAGANKGKGVGQQRMLYTNKHAAYDAGNRIGLPEEIEMGESPQEAWKNFIEKVKEARGTQSNG